MAKIEQEHGYPCHPSALIFSEIRNLLLFLNITCEIVFTIPRAVPINRNKPAG